MGILENVEKVVASSNTKEKAAKESVRKPPESATTVSARVLVPMTFEFPKWRESRKVVPCARSMGVLHDPQYR